MQNRHSRRRRFWLPWLAVLAQLWGCGDFTLYGDAGTTASLEAVIAWSAASGASQPLACETDKVKVSASESSGSDLTYTWILTIPDESEAALADTAVEQTTFWPDMYGSYAVYLQVVDSEGDAATDSASITVADTPIAVADAVATDICAGDSTQLEAGDSKNPLEYDGGCTATGLTFEWTATDPDGQDVTSTMLDDPSSSQPTFSTASSSTAGDYTLQLTVSRDADAETAEDTVTVTVEDCS
jgi:hypothetical protein